MVSIFHLYSKILGGIWILRVTHFVTLKFFQNFNVPNILSKPNTPLASPKPPLSPFLETVSRYKLNHMLREGTGGVEVPTHRIHGTGIFTYDKSVVVSGKYPIHGWYGVKFDKPSKIYRKLLRSSSWWFFGGFLGLGFLHVLRLVYSLPRVGLMVSIPSPK